MKKLALVLLLLVPIITFGQCVKCQSFEEADKDPAKVISIKINPNLTDITLEEIPATIAKYINLEVLYLTDHGFTSVTKEIGSLSKLKSLSLAGNELESLPEEIFQLKGLEELILFGNNFSDNYKAQLKKKLKEKLPNAKLMID
jgi:Leucine Rich Repeat (LRR) protein